MLTDFFKLFSPLDSPVNLPRGSRHISHHTCNASLHYLVKNNIKHSKILTYQSINQSLFAQICNKMTIVVQSTPWAAQQGSQWH